MRLLAQGLMRPRCATLLQCSALVSILTSTQQIQCTPLHPILLTSFPIYIHEFHVTPP